jgi:hypothetical protein
MYKLLAASLFGLLLFFSCQLKEDPPINDYKVHAIYVIPSDKYYSDDHAYRVGRGIIEIQRWYQTATGGLTFELLDEENIISVYFADKPVAYYEEDWWGLLLNEMRDKGEPIESSGTIAMIWIEGIQQLGATAIAQGAEMCGGECGASLMPITTVIGITWPPTDMGVSFHELGHALGLTHPVEEEDLPLPAEKEPMLYSVMCQGVIRLGKSNVEHGFLTNEKAILVNNRFLKKDVNIYQDFWQTNIINYPVTGLAPNPQITFLEINPHSYSFNANVDNALLYYWYFGDGSTSNDTSPTHLYNSSGLYNVVLMVTDNNQMATRVSKYVEIR